MPWDGTELWMADLGSDGYIANARYIAGGPEESLFQPEWSPTGELYVISDRTGWWNLYRVQDGELEPVYPIEAECGEPQWEFGYSTYAFVNARQVVVLSRDRGEDKLHLVDVADGQAEELDTQATSIKAYVSAANDQVAYIGGTARQVPAVRLRSGGGVTERAVTPPQHQRTTDKVKSPKRHWVPTHGRPPIPILLHPPAAPEQSDDSPVPLLVRPHPGPTSQSRARLDAEIQFFTSRGFAVAQVDYRGSTGYGRAYRQALTHLWGIADAEDCITVARWLVDVGRADPIRTVVSGASAGGFTALRALILGDVFVAASCVSGIVDLHEFQQRTHKFQRHELDRLVGTLPDNQLAYEKRSPLNLVNEIDRPVLLAHGLGDPVAPAAGVQALAKELSSLGKPHVAQFFSDEGHPLSKPESRAIALATEIDFYRETFAGTASGELANRHPYRTTLP